MDHSLTLPIVIIIIALSVLSIWVMGILTARSLRKEIRVYSREQHEVTRRLGAIEKQLEALGSDPSEDETKGG
jgi:hypothetical protein